MFETIKNSFKIEEVRKKILLTLFLLFVYRIGCWLPVPGISPEEFRSLAGAGTGNILNLLSQISGGALANGALLALGISPYINATIIMQLLTIAIPKLEQLSKQGEDGRKKINQYSRILTLLLAIGQAIGIVLSMGREAISLGIFAVDMPYWLLCIFVILTLTAGTAFTIWIGERITELGVGNGISLLIFIGIIATAGQAILALLARVFQWGTPGQMAMWELVGFAVLVVAVFTLIVFVDAMERKIPITYAKQIKGRKQYGGQSSHIPMKVNASGVMPIIFAMALLSFPQLVMSLFNPTPDTRFGEFYQGYMSILGPGTWLYMLLTALLILFFSYFYSQIQFNPEEVARNIQQHGGYVQGIRPGRATAEYLSRINKRLTLFGAIFLSFIALVPSVIFAAVLQDATLVNAFSATGLLIVVSVGLELNKQLEGQVMMKHYKGFLK